MIIEVVRLHIHIKATNAKEQDQDLEVASRSKGCHDKLGSKGGGLSQRPSDDCPILVEVEGPFPLESLGGR